MSAETFLAPSVEAQRRPGQLDAAGIARAAGKPRHANGAGVAPVGTAGAPEAVLATAGRHGRPPHYDTWVRPCDCYSTPRLLTLRPCRRSLSGAVAPRSPPQVVDVATWVQMVSRAPRIRSSQSPGTVARPRSRSRRSARAIRTWPAPGTPACRRPGGGPTRTFCSHPVRRSAATTTGRPSSVGCERSTSLVRAHPYAPPRRRRPSVGDGTATPPAGSHCIRSTPRSTRSSASTLR